MTFEATTSLSMGASITARLIAERNSVEVEIIGHPAPDAVGMAVPRVMQHLADKARLPIRWQGATYFPGKVPENREEWQ